MDRKIRVAAIGDNCIDYYDSLNESYPLISIGWQLTFSICTSILCVTACITKCDIYPLYSGLIPFNSNFLTAELAKLVDYVITYPANEQLKFYMVADRFMHNAGEQDAYVPPIPSQQISLYPSLQIPSINSLTNIIIYL